MNFIECFPVYNRLNKEEQSLLMSGVTFRKIKKGTVIRGGANDCTGLVLIWSGQLRAYIVSDEGKEVTIYRLLDRDVCLLSASCMMPSMQFDVTVTAEKDTEAWIIPIKVYKPLMDSSAQIANYTNELLCTRFTEVMWLIEQILWKSFDKRLALFLIDECNIEDTSILHITHEHIAAHLGKAREVVTRMLKSFHNEGAVSLTRGAVIVTDHNKLKKIAGL